AGSCGGSKSSSNGNLTTQPSDNPPVVELASNLPGLPADEQLHLSRMVAAATAVTLGADYDQAAPGTAQAGTDAVLASAANTVSYALYRFGGVPGENIQTVGYRVSGKDSGERVFAAIGNYSTGRWSYFAEQAASDVTL